MYNWTEEITAPFLSHRVRLWVHTMAGMQETFTSLVVVPAVNISQLIRHMYWSAMVQTRDGTIVLLTDRSDFDL